MIDTDLDAITICLYVAIPEKEESRKDVTPWPRRLKSLTKNSLDRVASKISQRLHLDLYHYETAHGTGGGNSNRGDIAIRMAIREQLTQAFAPRPVRFLEVKWGELTDYAAAEINACCDIFVIGGGGYIFLTADGSLGHMMASVEELDKIHCPVFAYGIGLNRLMHEKICSLDSLPEISRQKIRFLSRRCELISVRDHETAKLFDICAGKLVAVTGDPVLTCTPAALPALARDAKRPRIGVNLAAHGWRALSILKPLLPSIIAFLEDVQRIHNAELVYLQHHDLESPVIEFLHGRGLKFETISGTPADLLNGYAGTDFVFCQMLHACIFAASAGRPFLNIAYDDKSIAFGKLLNVPECCLPHAAVKPGVLEGTFAHLYQDRARLHGRLEARKSELRIAQQRFTDEFTARALILASQYDFAGKDDQPGDLVYPSEAEIGAIVEQARNSGAGLH